MQTTTPGGLIDNPAGNGSRAILLLGHGSKAPEANETLRKIAAAVKRKAGYGFVLPAFLQMEQPDFQEAVDRLVSEGYNDITVMPYFLYMGLHVTQDLPEEIRSAKERHDGLTISLAENLGYHDKLVDITIERIEELLGAGGGRSGGQEPGPAPGPFVQHPIEKESFRIIGEELDAAGIAPEHLPVIKRVIHTTADFEFADILRFSPGAVSAGIEAFRSGANVITDVNMVKSGITPARLAPFGSRVLCFTADEDVAATARSENMTRTAAAMRKAADLMDGAIVAVGNAPTALLELLRLVRDGLAAPALIIGVPVGFVDAVEAKEELMVTDCEFISVEGRKGGSTVAVAIVNALAIAAAGGFAE